MRIWDYLRVATFVLKLLVLLVAAVVIGGFFFWALAHVGGVWPPGQ